MSVGDQINDIVDGYMSRIRDNIRALGGTADSLVIEGDEEPNRITRFPSFFVIPLIEGGDTVQNSMSSDDELHEFTITILGVYRKNTVPEFIRQCRSYAFACDAMFRGAENYKVHGPVLRKTAVNVGSKVQVYYHRVSPNIIHGFSVRLTVQAYLGGD